MNNKNKKDQILIFLFFIFTLVFSVFFTSCPDPFNAVEFQTTIAEGKGSFSLTLSDTSRTIMPSTPGSGDFAVYCLNFTPINGGAALHIDRTNATLSSQIFLEPGSYSLSLKAYKDNSKTLLIAAGTADNIAISAGVISSAIITLKASLSGETGNFSWNIVIPLDVSSASMLITPVNTDGTVEQVVSLSQFNTAGNRTLNSGLYNITIKLEKPDGKKVVWHKLLYVYQNLESVYNYTFTNAHFIESKYTITYKFNDGITADMTDSVLHGGVLLTGDPVRSGYIFRGWFTDNNTFTNQWNFNQHVINTVTLFAKWEIFGDVNIIVPDNQSTLSTNEEITLIALVEGVASNNISWSSSHPDIAYVNDYGVVTADKPGVARITATRLDNGKTDEWRVRVYRREHSQRYIAIPYTGNDKIKYSYSYEGVNYYYVYLGELSYIPLFTGAVRKHEDSDGQFRFFQTEINTISITKAVSNSSTEVRGTVETHTNSATTGGKLYAEANAKGTFLGIGVDAKSSAEYTWSKFVSDTTTNTFQQTTSLTVTSEHATTDTIKIGEDSVKQINSDNRPGNYRFTMFSSSDVYLFVIRDTKTNEFTFDFEEFIKRDVNFEWEWDYSDTNHFGKTDDSKFELDLAILDILPQPEYIYDVVKFHTNSNVPGIIDASEKEIIIGFRPAASQPASLGVLPTPPVYPGTEISFLYWNTKPDGSGEIFTENTPVNDTVNVYAQYGKTYYHYHDASTFDLNTGEYKANNINTGFDLQKLKDAGYEHIKISLYRLDICTRIRQGASSVYILYQRSDGALFAAREVYTPANNTNWIAYNAGDVIVAIDDFDPNIFVNFHTGNGLFKIGTRMLVIEAIKK